MSVEDTGDNTREEAWAYFEKNARHDPIGNFYRIYKPFNTREEYVANDTAVLFKSLLKNWKTIQRMAYIEVD